MLDLFKLNTMKKFLLSLLLLFITILPAQEKVSINKQEITIPIGKKIWVKPEIEDGRIIRFEIIREQDISGKVDLFELLKHFEKDDKKDNSIEFTFSEARMMDTPLFALVTIQRTGKKMTFKAKIRLKGDSAYFPTSILPIGSNIISIEQWKDTIDSIFLYDFKLEG